MVGTISCAMPQLQMGSVTDVRDDRGGKSFPLFFVFQSHVADVYAFSQDLFVSGAEMEMGVVLLHWIYFL